MPMLRARPRRVSGQEPQGRVVRGQGPQGRETPVLGLVRGGQDRVDAIIGRDLVQEGAQQAQNSLAFMVNGNNDNASHA